MSVCLLIIAKSNLYDTCGVSGVCVYVLTMVCVCREVMEINTLNQSYEELRVVGHP